MGDAALAADPKFATVMERMKRRAETDGKVAAAFATMDVETLSKKLEAADIAFARVNDVAGFIAHPHLRRISVETPSGPVSYPAPGADPRPAAQLWPDSGQLGEHHREGAEGSSAQSSADAEATPPLPPRPSCPRSDAVDPIANTNGIASTQIAVSSMKSLA